ncbi:organic cation/carnitine transporter 2-like [Panonychus citri]|uniref:organic cation/carnitine transporter 2-like n=1 Tax=Panonychus citri TaxID=50023 RepID=UPI002306F9B3|nr:organic cation/carnitine transporter 2-like [Panonychus citri]
MSRQQETKSLKQSTNPNHDDLGENVQHVSGIIGGWGPLQRRLMFLLVIVYWAAPFNNQSLLYYVIKSDLWCVKPSGVKVAIRSDRCTFANLNKCASWGHNTTRGTVTKEWNMVCENYWQRSLALSAYQIGYLISGPLVGSLSDKFGRKKAIIGCILTEIICGILLFLSSSIQMFTIVRIIHGIGGFGRYLASLLLLVESVGPKVRGKVVVSFDWIWFGGEYVMILVTYFVSNFRHIYLGSAIFQIFCLTIVMPKVTESIRWQLVNGQENKAEKVLRKYSVGQGKMDEDTFQLKFASLRDNVLSSLKSTQKKETIFNLYRNPTLLKYCCGLYVIWFTMIFNFYGLTYTTLDLSGNIFINNAFFTIAGIVALVFLTWKVEKIKRKKLIFVLCMCVSMTLFYTIPLVNSSQYLALRTILLTVGKFFAASTMLTLYVYSPEVFPTSIRHLGVGTCSTAARIATISAPYVAQFTARVDLRITLALFATFGLIGAATSFILPETKDKEITDTVDELIKQNTKSNDQEMTNQSIE